MKRKIKNIIFLSSIISLPVLINFLIFKNVNKNIDKKEENFYNWRFGKIRYITIGNGDPLLLIHDMNCGSSLEEWNENILQLSKHYKVYAIDLLGYGLSEKPKISYSPYLYVSLINDFISNVIKEKVNIIASGTSVGFAVMSQSFLKPLIKKIIIISPKRIEPLKINVNNYDSYKKFILELPVLGTSLYNIANSKLATKISLDKKYFERKKYVNEDLIKKTYINSHSKGSACKYTYASYITNFLDIDIRQKLENIDIPVHIVWGDKDELNPISNLDYLDIESDNIELTVFTDTKSYPHIENPRAFYKVCKKFFK